MSTILMVNSGYKIFLRPVISGFARLCPRNNKGLSTISVVTETPDTAETFLVIW